MYKPIGFELIYPDGCKEISECIRLDELKRRLNDLAKALAQLVETESLQNESSDQDNSGFFGMSNDHNKYRMKGLLLHLCTPQFTLNSDVEVRLRVATCICHLIKLYCPTNPLEGLSNGAAIMKTCCQVDVLLWCNLVDDGEELLLESLKVLIGVTKNINVWAWSSEDNVKQLLLDVLCHLISRSDNLINQEITTYLMRFLIDPLKTANPEQYNFVRDLVIRTSTHLEYHIQMLLQSFLVVTSPASKIKANASKQDKNAHTVVDIDETSEKDDYEEEADSSGRPDDTLGEHSFLLIYALHKIQESLVAPILPTIELKLKSHNSRERKRAFRLLARLFSEPSSTLYQKYPSLWDAFLGRFHDISSEVRRICVHMVPQLLKNNPDLPQERIRSSLKERVLDHDEGVRLLALKIVSILVKESLDSISDDYFTVLKDRSRDKSLAIRKEALGALACIFKRALLSCKDMELAHTPNLSQERISTTLNTILHLYYQSSTEDKCVILLFIQY
ncbi:unnamed protein product [Protopolystoma xenopodis]|uniref:Condensin complex subunit 1 C-terminal domain-containing protein n=1 Tax=Protopolystoma xenopodis TaxID=117903 RepID=A0A448WVG5_9PLAT|nr:unnamed protein product [Protopolystoma xenopodis]